MQAVEQVPVQFTAHTPPAAQLYAPQPFSGSLPAGRLVHVPRVAAERLQVTHGPTHEVSQQ